MMRATILMGLLLATGQAGAQAYPARPIRFIVPSPTGWNDETLKLKP